MPTFTERVAALSISEELLNEPDRWIDIGHARLPYWIIGSGPALVLVHGWPVDARTWRRIVPVLAERFTQLQRLGVAGQRLAAIAAALVGES